MEKRKLATRGQIGRIMNMLFSGAIDHEEAQQIIERHTPAKKNSKAPQAQLFEREYRIHVDRGPLPPMSKLEEMFGDVTHLYNGEVEWVRHTSRQGLNDVTDDEVVMVVKYFTQLECQQMGGLEREGIIAWGLKNGLVPADEKEAYAFGINPQARALRGNLRIRALGSSIMRDEYCFVPMLDDGLSADTIPDPRAHYGWSADDGLLFVRKAA